MNRVNHRRMVASRKPRILGGWALVVLPALLSCLVGPGVAPRAAVQEGDELKESEYPRRYPVAPLVAGPWRDLFPQDQQVGLWNGRIVRADTQGVAFFGFETGARELPERTVAQVRFPEDGSGFRPLRNFDAGPFHPPPILDFPGYEYNRRDGQAVRDQVVLLGRDGARQAAFVVESRWRTTLSPGAEVLAKHGPLGVLVADAGDSQDVAGYSLYRRGGDLLCQVDRKTRLFFEDVNDRGYSLAFERERETDSPKPAMGPGGETDNPVTGFALLDPDCKVVFRRAASRVDQLVFTGSGERAVVGVVDFDGQRYRRRTEIFDLQGGAKDGPDMTGMLFGQAAGPDFLVFTRAGVEGQPWRWTEILVYDAAAGRELHRFPSDVEALGAQSILAGERHLFVYFEAYQDRREPHLTVLDIQANREIFNGAWFESPSTQYFTFKDYGDREHVLFASPNRLWLTSGAIVEAFARGRSR